MKPSVLQVVSHLHVQVTLWELPAQPLMSQQDRRFCILDHVSQPLLWVMGVHWQVCPSSLQHSCSRQTGCCSSALLLQQCHVRRRQEDVAVLHSSCSRQQDVAGLHSWLQQCHVCSSTGPTVDRLRMATEELMCMCVDDLSL